MVCVHQLKVLVLFCQATLTVFQIVCNFQTKKVCQSHRNVLVEKQGWCQKCGSEKQNILIVENK